MASGDPDRSAAGQNAPSFDVTQRREEPVKGSSKLSHVGFLVAVIFSSFTSANNIEAN